MTTGARRALLWPLLVALVVRLACLPLGSLIAPSGDALGYVFLAQEYRTHGGFSELALGVRPPLQRMLLAPGLDASTSPPSAWPGAYLIQIGMDLLALALLMQLARRRFGDRAAVATGWLYALLPQAILYSSAVIMAETAAVLAIAAALLALDSLERALDRAGAAIAPRVVLLGMCLGLGILTKELLVPVTAIFALALLLRPAPRLAHRLGLVAGTCAVALLVTTPWLAYTQQRYGVPILSGTFGDMGLGLDNTPPGESSRRFFKEYIDLDVPGRMDYAQAVFRRALLEYPGLTAQRAAGRLRIAAGPEDALPIWIAMTFDGFQPDASSNLTLARQSWVLPAGWGRSVQVLCGVCALLLFAVGAAGLAAAPRSTLKTVALLALCVILVTLALTVSTARYRHGMVPFVLPFAGYALSLLIDRAHRPETEQHGTRRAACCGLAVAVLLTVTMFCLPAP